MNRNPPLRYFHFAIAAMAVGLSFSSFSFAQDATNYPTKPVRVIVALPPGGGNDTQARAFAQKLSESLKQQFVVDNRPGAGGAIGYGFVAKSAPDGYTLLSVGPTFTIGSALRADLPYDPIKEFVPISLVTRAPYLLLVHPTLPVKSVRELIALAKSRPDALNVAVTSGGATHLGAYYLNSAANVKITVIPYTGTGPTTVSLLSGQVHMSFGNVLAALPHVKSGRMRALAVTSIERAAVLPELPTISESGVRGYNVIFWHGWAAPASTPVAILGKLSVELSKAVRSPDIVKNLAEDGGEPVGSTPEQFRLLITDEISRWRKVVKDVGKPIE